ncbi:MAG: hypothetical protein JW963_11880 [Anaerolineales bacterium]|nr:hypothetical protein [Anaerolineales bacterium]
MSKQQNNPSLENLESLEAHLAGTLRPVAPPKDFAQRLRDRIRFPERGVFVNRLRDWNRLFLVFGGVMSGMLVVITIARALYYLVGRRNMA